METISIMASHLGMALDSWYPGCIFTITITTIAGTDGDVDGELVMFLLIKISVINSVSSPTIYTPSPPPQPVTGRPHKIVVKLLKEETILRFQDWGKGNGLTFPDLYLTHNVAPRSPVLPVVPIHYQFHHGITHRRHWADGPFSLSSSSDTALGESFSL